MGSAALEGRKLYSSGLAACLGGQETGQIACGSGQLSVTKGIYIIASSGQLAYIPSVRYLDALRNCNYNGRLLFQQVTAFFSETGLHQMESPEGRSDRDRSSPLSLQEP